jgi:hypothetical protein
VGSVSTRDAAAAGQRRTRTTTAAYLIEQLRRTRGRVAELAADLAAVTAQRDEIARQTSALLAAEAVTGPAVPLALAREWSAGAYRRGLGAGLGLAGTPPAPDVDPPGAWPVAALGPLEGPVWHLCCGPCRRAGHRAGCARCEDRTRATFSQPHPDDYQGGAVRWDGPEAAGQ